MRSKNKKVRPSVVRRCCCCCCCGKSTLGRKFDPQCHCQYMSFGKGRYGIVIADNFGALNFSPEKQLNNSLELSFINVFCEKKMCILK